MVAAFPRHDRPVFNLFVVVALVQALTIGAVDILAYLWRHCSAGACIARRADLIKIALKTGSVPVIAWACKQCPAEIVSVDDTIALLQIVITDREPSSATAAIRAECLFTHFVGSISAMDDLQFGTLLSLACTHGNTKAVCMLTAIPGKSIHFGDDAAFREAIAANQWSTVESIMNNDPGYEWPPAFSVPTNPGWRDRWLGCVVAPPPAGKLKVEGPQPFEP